MHFVDIIYNKDATTDVRDYLCEGEEYGMGDDDKCKIPDSFKLVLGNSAVDVVAFFDIHRADPLKTPQKSSEAGDCSSSTPVHNGMVQ